jgi:hypothetical protein
MRFLAIFLAAALTLPAQQVPAGLAKLNLVVVEGEGAINNIRQRTAREPIVQVEDENHRPVAGVAVVFTLPNDGATGFFSGGSRTLTVMSDNQGRAVARGFRPNNTAGQYQMRVTASKDGQTASVTIGMTNLAAAAGAAAGAGISAKVIALIVVGAAAGVAGGVVAATRGNGNNNNTAVVVTQPTVISAGAGTVGPPR